MIADEHEDIMDLVDNIIENNKPWLVKNLFKMSLINMHRLEPYIDNFESVLDWFCNPTKENAFQVRDSIRDAGFDAHQKYEIYLSKHNITNKESPALSTISCLSCNFYDDSCQALIAKDVVECFIEDDFNFNVRFSGLAYNFYHASMNCPHGREFVFNFLMEGKAIEADL